MTGAISIAGHAAVALALLLASPVTPLPPEPRPMTVALVELQPPAPTPQPPTPAPAKPARATPPPPMRVHRLPAPHAVDPLPAPPARTAAAGTGLTDGQIAGAALADAGTPGGACDMARRLQSALRKDPLVRAELAGNEGKAIMVWNGDWIRNGEEDGKGLAAVREAILWEVGFAPRACRSAPVRGLILLSLNEARGPVRLAVGTGQWRWSDLLTPRAEASDEASQR
jgi:hypothetical protein